ncbi:glb-13 [Pristionchus pacificus]|uniref:Glb-13 n=1 Tax=Pristionchus pacificus TaxID=54126 RepID=A0A2A6D313_PRIPA|nr:glb-13 [Pristionchus pacificus]|eukprot:PDM84788.1 glb-13 [Pristionchus pacificus]
MGNDSSRLCCRESAALPANLASMRYKVDGGRPRKVRLYRPENTILAKSVGCINAKQHFMHRRDRLLISKSWMKAQKTGAEYIGAKIFHRLLTAQPEIKTIFGLEHIPHEMLKYDLRFRQHSLVYTKTIDYVVKNLEFPHYLEQHFELLGRRHVQYQGRGFDPSWWDSFAECMTEAAAEWELHRNRPATSAWRILVSNIIMFMRRGFDDEIGRMKEKVVVG